MQVEKILEAEDSTGKIAIRLNDGSIIESVLLVDQTNRATACLSSQVGCSQKCSFCRTGSLGLKRNLTTEEILIQFDLLKETFKRDITNIVFMGMGEPLQNIDFVLESIRIFTNPKKYNIFLRRVTISTSGYIQGFNKLLESKPYPGLAFSLITANQNLRKKIMPASPSLDIIKENLLVYQEITKKRIIIEVIVFKLINSTFDEALLIKEFLIGLDTIINLIPYNSTGSGEYEEPLLEDVELFSKMLLKLGLKVTIRHSKGQEISGACGQLGDI